MLTTDIPLALTFDDVLLVPQRSEVLPRDVVLASQLAPGLQLQVPLLSAAMDTVTEGRMAIAMARLGGLGVIHKNMSPQAQATEVRRVKRERGNSPLSTVDSQGRLCCAAAVGVGGDRDERVAALVEAGVDVLIIDTAHGHSMGVLSSAAEVKKAWPDLTLVVGNVATGEATRACIEHGADVVKVGVGPGSICTTRIVAGVGVPQLSAIADCSAVAHELGKTVIADGGIKFSGDAAKAFAAGADAVMMGSLLAGTDEAPGDTVVHEGRKYKSYRGMGSIDAMKAGSSDRYFQAEEGADPQAAAPKLVPEGIVGQVLFKGAVEDVVFQMVGGLRASMGYCGCGTISQMQRDTRFVRISSAGLRESHVHDVTITQEAPNYRSS